MVVLVTGAAGFIGSHLCEKLLEMGHEVVGIDNMQTGKIENITHLLPAENFAFIKIDINDWEQCRILFEYQFDYIFHYAACVGVERTLTKPLEVLSDIEGIKNVLEIAKVNPIKRFFYSSSSEVYGEPLQIPQNEETTPLNCRLTYATVKKIGELYVKAYDKEHSIPYTIFRFFNTYGPRQSESFVISKFMRQAKENRDITVYGSGRQTRCFIHITDNIKATINAMDNPSTIRQTINIGSNEEVSALQFAKMVKEITHSNSKITRLPALKEGDFKRRVPDNRKMKKLLNISTLIPLKEGLKTLL